MKTTLLLVMTISAAAALGWYVGHRAPGENSSPEKNGTARKIAYYQSPMHPWIKSDKPGNCTICGMKLAPVYEGEKGLDLQGNIVALSSNAINVLHVQTAPAELHAIEKTLRVAGKIEAEETRYKMLAAYVEGRIEELFVNYVGAEVAQGQPLALLYSPTLATAEREYVTALAQTSPTDSLARDRERMVAGARTRLKRLGLTEDQIDAISARSLTNLTTQIVAPIGGTVLSKAVVEGQYVKEGDKLFEIADLSQMWFRFEVYEQDLPSIRLGQIVRVTSPGLGDKVFTGPITFIEPNINEASRSARVRVELANPLLEENGQKRRILYNGLFANGTIALRSEPALAVNRTAVVDLGDQPRVYVDKGGGAYARRAITLGDRGEGWVQILDGLSPGERVVTSGNLLLDSQAQISGSAESESAGEPSSPVQPGAAEAHVAPKLNEAARRMIDAGSKLSGALARDDRESFNELLPEVSGAATNLSNLFSATEHLGELAAAVAKSADLKPAQNLVIARTEFLPFSMALAEFTQALRKHGGAMTAKVFKCPMYPQAGKTAYWIQAEGALRNPFFGSEMLDCGQEVK